MTNLTNKICQYFKLKQAIHDAFGYKEGWVTIPLEDYREYYWVLTEEDVTFHETLEGLESDGDYYSHDIYKQRFLTEYVYETEEYTLVSVDTNMDGNKYLAIFDNTKRR